MEKEIRRLVRKELQNRKSIVDSDSHSSSDESEKKKRHSKCRQNTPFYYLSAPTGVIIQNSALPAYPSHWVSWGNPILYNTLKLKENNGSIEFPKAGTYKIQWKVQIDIPTATPTNQNPNPINPLLIYPNTRDPPLVNLAWYSTHSSLPYQLISTSQVTLYSIGHHHVESFFLITVPKKTTLRLGVETVLDKDVIVGAPLLDPQHAVSLTIEKIKD